MTKEKSFFKSICVPLILIDSNIYAFFSGILMSLSTNIFTSLRFERIQYSYRPGQYLATFFFILSSAICMLISVKVVNIQNYFQSQKINDVEEKKDIVIDVTKKTRTRWFVYFILLFASFIVAVIMLFDIKI